MELWGLASSMCNSLAQIGVVDVMCKYSKTGLLLASAVRADPLRGSGRTFTAFVLVDESAVSR